MNIHFIQYKNCMYIVASKEPPYVDSHGFWTNIDYSIPLPIVGPVPAMGYRLFELII